MSELDAQHEIEQTVQVVEEAQQAVQQARANTILENVQNAHQQVLYAKQQLLMYQNSYQSDTLSLEFLQAKDEIEAASEQMDSSRQVILEEVLEAENRNDQSQFRTESLN